MGAGGLALDGSNYLFVANTNLGINTVGEYDAITGATINAAFVNGQGILGTNDVVFVPVPEPSSLLLVVAAAGIGVARRRWRKWIAGRGTATALVAVCAAVSTAPVQAQPVLFASNRNNNTLGAYDAATGATMNSAFIGPGQGLNQPFGMAVDGNNHLFVASYPGIGNGNGWVGQYDATTGATINANFLTVPAGNNDYGFSAVALDGNGHIFAARDFGVSEYNATTAHSSTGTSLPFGRSTGWLGS